MIVTTVDPSTGAPLASYEETRAKDLDVILDLAYQAAAAWRTTSPAERAAALRRLAAALRGRRDGLAVLATREMGKPLAESLAEVDKCAWTCEWFAGHGPAMLEPEPADTGAVRTRILYVPLGVIFAIMPWNFPYWQGVRALAPAGMAGNVLVLKHAPSTTGCALLLADVAAAAGLPEGVLSVVVASTDRTAQVSERIIS